MRCRETVRIGAGTEHGDGTPLLQSTAMPHTESFFRNVEKRVANDGKAYTYAEFEHHYGRVRAREIWNRATAPKESDVTLRPQQQTKPESKPQAKPSQRVPMPARTPPMAALATLSAPAASSPQEETSANVTEDANLPPFAAAAASSTEEGTSGTAAEHANIMLGQEVTRTIDTHKHSFEVRRLSGEIADRYEGKNDLSMEKLMQDFDEGFIEDVPRARTDESGRWLEHYVLHWGTLEIVDGQRLSDYNMPPSTILTLTLVPVIDV